MKTNVDNTFFEADPLGSLLRFLDGAFFFPILATSLLVDVVKKCERQTSLARKQKSRFSESAMKNKCQHDKVSAQTSARTYRL